MASNQGGITVAADNGGRHDAGYLNLKAVLDEIHVDLACKEPQSLRIPRPHLSFEEQLVTGKSYSLPSISYPKQSVSSQSTISREKDNYEVKLKYPQRFRRLHIFPSSKTEVWWNEMAAQHLRNNLLRERLAKKEQKSSKHYDFTTNGLGL